MTGSALLGDSSRSEKACGGPAKRTAQLGGHLVQMRSEGGLERGAGVAVLRGGQILLPL